MSKRTKKRQSTVAERITEGIASCHQKLTRGTVWCVVCDRAKNVNAVYCMKHGWPKCCGLTMTLDSPKEREELSREEPE